MIWKYTNSTNRVVYRINDDGSMESHSVNALVIKQWLDEGNIPEASDE